MTLTTHDVIRIFSEATSGPLSSGPAPAGGQQIDTQFNQDTMQPKKIDDNQMKNMVQDAIKNIGMKLNLEPNQVPDFSTKFQAEIQKELTDLQNKAKIDQQNPNTLQ